MYKILENRTLLVISFLKIWKEQNRENFSTSLLNIEGFSTKRFLMQTLYHKEIMNTKKCKWIMSKQKTNFFKYIDINTKTLLVYNKYAVWTDLIIPLFNSRQIICGNQNNQQIIYRTRQLDAKVITTTLSEMCYFILRNTIGQNYFLSQISWHWKTYHATIFLVLSQFTEIPSSATNTQILEGEMGRGCKKFYMKGWSRTIWLLPSNLNKVCENPETKKFQSD